MSSSSSSTSSSEINIIAIITPHTDKFSIVEDLVKDLAPKVHANEPGVLAYQAHVEKKKDGSGTIVFVEKYKDKAALAAHAKTDYFQAFSKKLAADKLVAAPMQIKMVRPFAGYSSRL